MVNRVVNQRSPTELPGQEGQEFDVLASLGCSVQPHDGVAPRVVSDPLVIEGPPRSKLFRQQECTPHWHVV